jgi:hypothetical protein
VSLVLPLGILLAACSLALTGEQPDQRDAVLGRIKLTPTAGDAALVATGAIADFGVNGGGARQVRVRIVDSLDVGVGITTDRDITLAEPPIICLVGPYSAPDDAGLSSPCWGQPDLTSLLLPKLAQDAAGHYLLSAGQPIELDAQLNRGTERCDYPPGRWEVELKLNPLVDGGAAGARYVPDTEFDVPLPSTGPLQLLPTTETRYCGLATAVVQQQGEPEVVEP